MIIVKEVEFSSGHYLPGHIHCGHPHGHNFRLRVFVSGEVRNGMVMDFAELKLAIQKSLEGIDHENLNDTLEMPTAENLVSLLAGRIIEKLPKGVRLKELELWETSSNGVIWRPDGQ